MSTPNNTAPPIPHTLELDTHTKQFFDPAEWSGPVAARFKLEHPALAGLIFIGRTVRICSAAFHLVVQEFGGDPVVDGENPTFISTLAVPFATADLEERGLRTRQFFPRYLSYPDPHDEQNWQSGVPTLRGAVARSGLRSLHFDARTGLGFDFHPTGCSIVDVRDARSATWAICPCIELGDALFDFEPPESPGRAFIKMEAATFHARVEGLLLDDTCALLHSVRFHRMDLFERCRHVFVCGGKSLRDALAQFKLRSPSRWARAEILALGRARNGIRGGRANLSRGGMQAAIV